jgi:hypothetical protein
VSRNHGEVSGLSDKARDALWSAGKRQHGSNVGI